MKMDYGDPTTHTQSYYFQYQKWSKINLSSINASMNLILL